MVESATDNRTHASRPPAALRPGSRQLAFSLVELLAVIAIIAVLAGVLLPSLAAARAQARRVRCAANLGQLGRAFHMYAGDHRGRAMPLAYTSADLTRGGPPIYWWGASDANGVDHTRGFTWPYLSMDLKANGLYECPEQTWGTYTPQGAAQAVTSTYGYNGYYLSPPHTPGWSWQIGDRPWQNLDVLVLPQRLLGFADTMIDWGAALPSNCALLDPPLLYQGGGRWSTNRNPTTSFRHAGRTNAAFADGHVDGSTPAGAAFSSARFKIGSIGSANDPHYVPDWREW